MPFLTNAWYAACWADELQDKPLGRTILGEPLVLYRADTGAVRALSDTCPHRFAPRKRRSAPLSRILEVGSEVTRPFYF